MSVIKRNQNRMSNATVTNVETLFSDGTDGDREYMGVAQGSEQIIFEMLSDLSSNRGAYVLREAYSNAVDATRATGSMDGEIDITIPDIVDDSIVAANDIATKLVNAMHETNGTRPNVVVSDHGIGMSEAELRHYFLQYGGSLKRSDVDAIGSKGLGAKAPLAITDAFEVRTRKDGIETVASISRDGGASYASISTHATDAGNGTDVIIPVTDVYVLRQIRECADVLMQTNVDANLVVNGRHASVMGGKGSSFMYVGDISIGNDADGNDVMQRLYWNNQYGPDIVPYLKMPSGRYVSRCDVNVVLGGYPYDITSTVEDRPRVSDLSRNGWFVTCEPGYLNFTPSRDAIKNDEYAQRLCASIIDGIRHIDMSGFANRCLENTTLAGKLRMLDDSDVLGCTPIIASDDGNHYEASAWRLWNAKIDAESVDYHGIDLIGLSKSGSNSNESRQSLRNACDSHIDYGEHGFLTVTRVFDHFLHNDSWRVNRHEIFKYKNDCMNRVRQLAEMDKEDAGKSLLFNGCWTDAITCDWDDALLRGNRTIVIVRDMPEKDAPKIVNNMANIARLVSGDAGTYDGHSLTVIAAQAGTELPDEPAMDVLRVISGDAAVRVMGWDEVVDGLRKQSAQKRANAKKHDTHAGTSVCYDFSKDELCGRGWDSYYTWSSHQKHMCVLGEIDWTHTSFMIVNDKDMCKGDHRKALRVALALVLSDAKCVSGINRFVVLGDPYVADIKAVADNGGHILCDLRSNLHGQRKRPQCVIANDGKWHGCVMIDDDLDVSIDLSAFASHADMDEMTHSSIMRALGHYPYDVRNAIIGTIVLGLLDGTEFGDALPARCFEDVSDTVADFFGRISSVTATYGEMGRKLDAEVSVAVSAISVAIRKLGLVDVIDAMYMTRTKADCGSTPMDEATEKALRDVLSKALVNAMYDADDDAERDVA